MKKRLIFEFDEGDTECSVCPISMLCEINPTLYRIIHCDKYDLATLKFIKEDAKDS